MKIPWSTVLHIGAGIVGQIVPGVAAVEQIATSLGGLHGQQKQDAVVDLVQNALRSSESLIGHNLANDADVEKATRGVIDAIVGLHAIVATKAMGATP